MVYGDQVANRTAEVNGSRLLRITEIAQYILDAKNAQADRLHIRQDEPVRAYLNALKADVRNLFDQYGQLLPIVDLDDDTANAVASVKVKRYTNPLYKHLDHEVVEVKFNSKLAAADALAKILGLTKEQPTGGTTIIERQVVIFGGKEIVF